MKIFSLIYSIICYIFCFINIGVFFFIERETVWLALASTNFLLGLKYFEDWCRYKLEEDKIKMLNREKG
jgi:hypothetical protein